MKARLKSSHGIFQKVKLVKNKYGLNRHGYQFPDGFIFNVKDCELEQPAPVIKNPVKPTEVDLDRRVVCFCHLCGAKFSSHRHRDVHIGFVHPNEKYDQY